MPKYGFCLHSQTQFSVVAVNNALKTNMKFNPG